MRRNWIWIAGIAALAIGCSKENNEPAPVVSGGSTTGSAAKPAGSFASVQGIMTEHCVSCHGSVGGKGGIDLTGYDGVMKGGGMGPIVKAGDPSGSVIVQALRGSEGMKQMPMKAPPLAEDDIKRIEDWIKAGAKSA